MAEKTFRPMLTYADEAHHSTAETYQKVMNYFKPKLFLGMTATPDKRDDGEEEKNVYELFHYQIAHEIRLQQAMQENLLCPFHYFGISDIYALDDKKLNAKRLEERDLNRLTSDERMKHIIEQAESILTEGLVLQDEKIWKAFLKKDIIPEHNACELYFEE